MATDLSGFASTLQLSVRSTASKAADLSTPQDVLSKVVSSALTFGTGDDQADQIFHDSRSLSGTTSEDLDFAGNLKNSFGSTISFMEIKAILIQNTSDNEATLEIGDAAAGGWTGLLKADTDIIVLPPGAAFMAISPKDGWGIIAGASDVLKVNNISAVDATYDIVVIGAND